MADELTMLYDVINLTNTLKLYDYLWFHNVLLTSRQIPSQAMVEQLIARW